MHERGYACDMQMEKKLTGAVVYVRVLVYAQNRLYSSYMYAGVYHVFSV